MDQSKYKGDHHYILHDKLHQVNLLILYGFIACSGIKMLQKTDLNKQKNLIIVSTVLSLGISGLVVGGTTISFSATALGLIVGIVLNLILKEDK